MDITLSDYIKAHTTQGDGEEHTADMFFFKMATQGEPDAETLRMLIRDHQGEFCDLDILDGGEHGYIQVGAWIGDQQIALRLMGLGQLLDLWEIFTPNPLPIPDEQKKQLAGAGMVFIRPPKDVREKISEVIATCRI